MALDSMTPRSRRALLTAAAGAAGALAAQAALPLTAAAAPVGMMTEQDNPTIATTSITDSGADSTAFASHATGTGYGVEATSTGGAGVFAWSVNAPAGVAAADLPYTGVFGSSPTHADVTKWAYGVVGSSPDVGVYGEGTYGVGGWGFVGVGGDASDAPGSIGVQAWAPTTAQIALRVEGKASFSRSGRKSMRSGTASKTIYLGGVTTSSKVFAVLASSESGRWVRAAVPTAGKFTVYLNTKLSSSATLAWFVLD